MNTVCFPSKDEVEVKIQLATGFGHWIAVVVAKSELDNFIAALLVLSPKIELKM